MIRDEDRSNVTLIQQVMQIGGETIADVEHRVNIDHFFQQVHFAQSRLKHEMSPGETPSQRTGDEQPIPRLRTTAQNRTRTDQLTDNRHVDDQRSAPTVGVTTGHDDVVLIGQLDQSRVNIVSELHPAIHG